MDPMKHWPFMFSDFTIATPEPPKPLSERLNKTISASLETQTKAQRLLEIMDKNPDLEEGIRLIRELGLEQ